MPYQTDRSPVLRSNWEAVHEALQSAARQVASAPCDDRLSSENRHPGDQQASVFVVRDPVINELPLFYAAHETEIADRESVAELSPEARANYLTRLIGKRFIDNDTGISFLGPQVGKGNPSLKSQNKAVREQRLDAAFYTLDRLPGKYLKDAYAHIVTALSDRLKTLSETQKLRVFLVRPGRSEYADDCTVNFLSLASTTVAEETFHLLEAARAREQGGVPRLVFDSSRLGVVLSRTSRSNASPLGRLVQQGYYDTGHFSSGDVAVLVDDHTQAGATLLSLGSALRQKGVEVLAAITPTVHPHTSSLKMSSPVFDALKAVMQRWDPHNKVGNKLAEMGMPLHTLTDAEALIVIAYATDPHCTRSCRDFCALEEAARKGLKVMEGEADSLMPVVRAAPKSPEEIVQEMDLEAADRRRVITPCPVTDVHVLDWDDFIRDEKGLNYQLMHNALAAAADAARPGDGLRELLQNLSLAVGEVRQGRRAFEEGMPKICMSDRQYRAFAMANPEFTKNDMARDLINQADSLVRGFSESMSALQKTRKLPDVKEILFTRLRSGFNREYKTVVRNALMPGVMSQAKAGLRASLPFPSPSLQLMAGAAQLLEDLRKPGNRVLLISNRSSLDVHNEVNALGLAHYFDAMAGREHETRFDAAQDGTRAQARVVRSTGKPDPGALQMMLSQIPGADSAKITLWGDRLTDALQGVPLVDHPGGTAAVIVSPNASMDQALVDLPFPARRIESLEDRQS